MPLHVAKAIKHTTKEPQKLEITIKEALWPQSAEAKRWRTTLQPSKTWQRSW